MAVASAQEATAAILPWLAKPQKLRFPPELNTRWIAACQRLHGAWANRHGANENDIRASVFALYSLTLETGDTDCLRLGEALAGAADRLEDNGHAPRLIAAMSATIESLNEVDGLEHVAFARRASHFAGRLEATATTADDNDRSVVLDQLFVDEALEQIQLMRDALAALPADAYALTTESLKLAQQAELLEIWGVMHLARQLSEMISRHAADLDNAEVLAHVDDQLTRLHNTIAAVNG